MKGPIFVGGAARSGKTLMRWILSSHSRITVSRRTDMWPRFAGRFGDLRRPENLERCLRAMLRRKQIARLEPDLDRLRRDLRQGPPTYARLFALIHQQHAERCGKERWGDQTEFIERFADELMAAYPGATVIHMIRDPRDRHEALLQRGSRGLGLMGSLIADWLSSAALAERNLERYPDSYLVVRYEDLVGRPEATVRQVCAVIGQRFEPAMLRMDGVRRYDLERARAADGSPISVEYLGKYRRVAPRDLAFIHAVAGARMRELGYVPDPVRLTPAERFHGALEWPVGLARLGAWRLRRTLPRRSTPATRGMVAAG
jgi:hypothetical protein